MQQTVSIPFFGVAAPGKCGDQVAFKQTPLHKYVRNLSPGYYFIGDAAYSVGESLLTPFTGGHCTNPIKDPYNFFLRSQSNRIEMAFSLLSNKWRVLNAPLQTSLACSSDICMACARLHNYCIDMDHHQNHHMTTVLLTGALIGWHHNTVHYRLIPGKSMTRDMIL